MSIPYFYEPGINSKNSFIVLSEETSRHCIQVLRMKAGNVLNLTDGCGKIFTASIINEHKKACEVKIQDSRFLPQKEKVVCIAISLLKNNNRFEWFLEKATETGVQKIIPILSERTERHHFRHERMNNILVAAMLQSEQCWLPVLTNPENFIDVIQNTIYGKRLIAHCEDEKKKHIKDVFFDQDVQILIGPEGDFTPGEIEMALRHAYQPVSLGNTRLRTETAGVVASYVLSNLE